MVWCSSLAEPRTSGSKDPFPSIKSHSPSTHNSSVLIAAYLHSLFLSLPFSTPQLTPVLKYVPSSFLCLVSCVATVREMQIKFGLSETLLIHKIVTCLLCNGSREFLSRIFNNQNEYDWLSVLQLHCVSTFNVIIWIKVFSFSHRPPNLYLSEHFHSQYLEILCSVQIWEPTPVYLRLNLQSADVTTTSALFYVLLSEDFLYIVLFGFPHFFSQSFSFFNFTNYFTWIALNKSSFFKSWS